MSIRLSDEEAEGVRKAAEGYVDLLLAHRDVLGHDAWCLAWTIDRLRAQPTTERERAEKAEDKAKAYLNILDDIVMALDLPVNHSDMNQTIARARAALAESRGEYGRL